MKVEIYTDGSSKGNPGPGGYGVLIRYRDPAGKIHEREYSGGFRMTTNNRMELMAVIVGLEALIRPCQVELYSDSRYIVDAFNRHWIDNWIRNNWKRGKQGVKNVDLWKRLMEAKKEHQVRFHWVKGHAGHMENEIVDSLAVSAGQADDLPADPGFS